MNNTSQILSEIILRKRKNKLQHQVKAYVLASEKAAFADYCEARDLSESEVVRRYVKRVTAQERAK